MNGAIAIDGVGTAGGAPESNRYFETVLTRERDRMSNIIGFCTSHDESGPPFNHRIPYFANLVISPVSGYNGSYNSDNACPC
jgi:hypothetical protein